MIFVRIIVRHTNVFEVFMNALNQQVFNNASDDKYETIQNTLLRIVVCVK